jgi:hypothetical protein
MLWFKALKGCSFFLVLLGLALLSESDLSITARELGVIHIFIGGIGYVLARGALGFTRRALDTVNPRPKGESR